MTARRPRRSGSVRFDPYYKIQWYDPVSVSWRDVQRRFATPEAAHRYAPALCPSVAPRYRLMVVDMAGRAPSPESVHELAGRS